MGTTPTISIPGEKLTIVSQATNMNAQIVFGAGLSSFTASSKPLAPLAMASFDENGNINVSAFIYIPNSKNGNDVNFQVNVLQTNSNKLAFYISHNASPKKSNTQYPYGISFSTSGVNYQQLGITKVKVYTWDDDPEGSRGTETTVEHS
ncbi:hypothetical protein [Tenacibaculum sp. MAR_2009_124]|uniref:hypothetical protein n=1 Tax=Tenacibaculum sp. MAR_2009_124 TaxID=1250059 RepID=UPI00115F8D3E|nr:hypothetical protein [Tenacibaculum sp. MAR_2009_124]